MKDACRFVLYMLTASVGIALTLMLVPPCYLIRVVGYATHAAWNLAGDLLESLE